MPSTSIRKRVYGIFRTTFSGAATTDDTTVDLPKKECCNSCNDRPSSSTNNSFISECILNGRNGKKNEAETYSGKTGLDLPVLMLEPWSRHIRASYTGPEGGLTEVNGIRRQPLVSMANLDDELSLSFDGDSLDECNGARCSVEEDQTRLQHSTSGLLGSCSSLINTLNSDGEGSYSEAESYNWNNFDEERCFGISKSLYEKNPMTGINAGNPIADVFGIIVRDNNVIMALADGVNWGEGSRLAARCAIRGAMDHLNSHLFAEECKATTEVFHILLGAFSSAHTLIIQEGGFLTTLCVAVAIQLRQSDTWALCVCNVGDSLCFVYSPVSGVREVTVASHDIFRMRDMRDAGGALGPVDGANPQLNNLTCSMTFVEPGDVIFITSDGVSDNFDPVVGKFCVIKSEERENKENDGSVKPDPSSSIFETNDQDSELMKARMCNACLPCVNAEQRHELMLLRMTDIVSNGILPPSARNKDSPTHRLPLGGVGVSSSQLCNNLIQFAEQLSMAKRRTLEDPELYRREDGLSKRDQRNHRKMVRHKLRDMPGKLDHATVVAFKVGLWRDEPTQGSHGTFILLKSRREANMNWDCSISCDLDFSLPNDVSVDVKNTFVNRRAEKEAVSLTVNLVDPFLELATDPNAADEDKRTKSPYEETPIIMREPDHQRKKRKHRRGSPGRHTLSVDITWLKNFVLTKNSSNGTPADPVCRHSMVQEKDERPSVSLRQRLRNIMGSARNIRQTNAKTITSGTGFETVEIRTNYPSSANTSPKKRLQMY
ncbi:unnamed protein product [Enterobius vermicularis]|uniref:PPM-type phosphatase domain-containing protein n=1 Tax=Enterobius vermicularis TaxID=51028 RepID=A0A0N4V3L7_ENTVE|nr:unnamed protein product [Enterobius vermicularis]